jgi:hypothetical protein
MWAIHSKKKSREIAMPALIAAFLCISLFGGNRVQAQTPFTAGQPQSTMVRQLWFGYLNGVEKMEGERWYFRYHAPEFIRWYGPWLRRYETFNAFDPPAEAMQRYGARPGKYTEMWWGSVNNYRDSRSGSTRPYTPGTWKLSTEVILTAMTMIPAYPTDIHTGEEVNLDMPVVRWMRVFRYPEGVSQEEGDKWYLSVYAEEAKKLPGLIWYVSYKTVDFRTPRPSGPYVKWHRVDEMWFPDMATWKKAALEGSVKFTAPSWAKDKQEPFVEMYSDLIRLKPDVDFLHDLPNMNLR